MRVVYRLPVQGTEHDSAVLIETQLDAMTVDSVLVELETEPKEGLNRLVRVTLTLSGILVRLDPATDTIITIDPEVEARAFTAASYVANLLRAETGLDGIHPFALVGNSPDIISPETPEEEDLFAVSNAARESFHLIPWLIPRPLCQEEWEHWRLQGDSEVVRSALATYAEGLRAQSPFIKFEQFYKVIEHCFPGKSGTKLDKAVSRYVAPLAAEYDEERLRELRGMRHRSMHPHVESVPEPHVSPQRLEDIRQVKQALGDMVRLAMLLLRNPPP